MTRAKANQAGALALAAALVISGGIPPARAADPGALDSGVTPSYDEAYYATLDYYGNLLEGSVVKSWALNGFDGFTDRGRYDQVVNLTDGTEPSREGDTVTFRFGEGAPDRFYFEGKTAEPFRDLPWTVGVRYTLNGVPARAEELAGQKGVVEILLDLTPNPNASDYARYNYTLEAAAMFNQDDILSLEAPGAQVQLVGNLRTVLFLALPGEEQHFVIRVGSNAFSFGGMTVLMVPATLAQLEEISKLSQRKDDLEEDYEALSGSLDSLLDALSDMQSGLSASADGLDRLDLARQTISQGKGGLYDSTDVLRGDLTNLADLLEPVEAQVQHLSRTVTDSTAILNELADTALDLQDELRDLEGALQELEEGTGSVKSLLRCAGDLQSSLRRLQSALGGKPSITPPDIPSGGSAGGLVDQVKEVHRVYEVIQEGGRAQAFEALLKLQGKGAAEAKELAKAADQLLTALEHASEEQVVLAKTMELIKEQQPGLTDEQYAAILASPQGQSIQAAVAEQIRTQIPGARQLDGLYQASQGASFQDFCASLPGVSQAQAKQMNDLWIIYTSGSLKDGKPGEPEGGGSDAKDPAPGEPGTENPAPDGSGTEDPSPSEPGTKDPAPGGTGTEDPSPSEPGTEDPAPGGTGTEDPAPSEPAPSEPGTENPAPGGTGSENSGSEGGQAPSAEPDASDSGTPAEQTLTATLAHNEPAPGDSGSGSGSGGDSGSSSSSSGDTGSGSSSSGDTGSSSSSSGDTGSGSSSIGDTGSGSGSGDNTGFGDTGSGDNTGSSDTGSGDNTGSGDTGTGDAPGSGGEQPIPPSGSVGGAVVDLITGGLDSASKELARLESEVSAELSRIKTPTAAVAGDLADLCGRLASLAYLMDDAEDLAAAARHSSREIRYILESADDLRDVLNDYEPTLQETLTTVGRLSASAVTTVRDAESLLGQAEGLMRESGVQLDAGTKQTLRGLASSLRQAAKAMNATGDVKAAKSTITGIIEDTWNEYTGDINNILLMDAEAEPVSLTNPENPAPSSIQVLLRTQEIREEDPAEDEEAAAAAAKTTFWGRIAQMFRDFWSAVTGIFR